MKRQMEADSSDEEGQGQEVEVIGNMPNPFSQYTSHPKPNDEILEALPLCSAYMTLSKFKYKIKLLPGNLKRGRVWKTCQALFGGVGSKSELERRALKGLPDVVSVNQLIGGCKVQAPGLLKIAEKQKRAKKQRKKNKKK